MVTAAELFGAVRDRNYDRLVDLFARNGQAALLTCLSLRSTSGTLREVHARERWVLRSFVGSLCPAGAEEKVDDIVQPWLLSRGGGSMGSDYTVLLRELAAFCRGARPEAAASPAAEALLRDAAAALADSRPPSEFVVGPDAATPIFDGSVATATPGTGGVGTLLHLACALDVPLALAFLLSMGADARASHTAFRRLMIHEAACNGSLQCLTLLLELGEIYQTDDVNAKLPAATRITPRSGGYREFDLPFLPRRLDREATFLFGQPEPTGVISKFQPSQGEDFLSTLQTFRDLVQRVKSGEMDELEAARQVMKRGSISPIARNAVSRSCGYGLPSGNLDGHGNTPLHWAAFKNETACVSLLLRYRADPNARAHPSGWTPLHDAAYSDSKESISLLIDAGAYVDARANSGATPLCFAAQEDAHGAAALLLARGANLSARCAAIEHHPVPHSRFSGYTPLHYCAHYNAQKAAKVLLTDKSARLAMEMPDLSDRLPIHVAVARGSSDVLREMLHAGARIDTQTVSPDIRRGGSPMSVTEPSSPGRRGFSSSPRITPRRQRSDSTPVSSPILRSMIPSQPVNSSKPWNCLTQRSIDECRELISLAEKNWAPDRHTLFTPADRNAVLELLKVGKRLELSGTGIFIDLWPLVLSFCGRGWFEDENVLEDVEMEIEDERLSLPRF